MRPQTSAIGLCDPSVIERVRERYVASDHQRASMRALEWRERTAPGPQHTLTVARQQRHRLAERLRPREPSSTTDPWVLGARALSLCTRLKPALGTSARLADLRELEELIRQLSWGPSD